MTLRTRLVFASIGLLLVAVAAPPPVSAAEAVLVIDGKGNGHGVGLAQDGALAMGRAGADLPTILQQFYPGTSLSSAGGTIRVRVLDGGAREARLTFPEGGEVRTSPSGPQPPGFPVVIGAGGSVTISYDGSRFDVRRPDGRGAAGMRRGPAGARQVPLESVEPPDGSTTTTTGEAATAAVPDTTSSSTSTTTSTTVPEAQETPASPPAPPPAPDPRPPVADPAAAGLWLEPHGGSTILLPARARRYRGAIEVAASAEGGVKLVNHVDVETYLKGMGEVRDPLWPAAGLQAQAVAARTYALRAVQGGSEICDDDRCQVYLGAQVEYGAMNRAVDDTAGNVLKHQGALAATYYSASAGGVTATPEEGFGGGAPASPYLVSAPYQAADPAPWNATIGIAEVGSRLDYPGQARTVAVSKRGPSGRALEVTVDGDAGPRVVTGVRFAARLGLRSTLFAFAADQAGVAPPAPVSSGPGQAAAFDIGSRLRRLGSPPVPASADTGGATSKRVALSVLSIGVAGLCLAEDRRRRTVRRLSRAGGVAVPRPRPAALQHWPAAPATGGGRRRWRGRR